MASADRDGPSDRPSDFPGGGAPGDRPSPPAGGWQSVGPGEVERRLRVEDPESRELFVELMERVARLVGSASASPLDPGSKPRLRDARLTVTGGRDAGGEPRPLDLVVRIGLDLDGEDPSAR